MSRSRGASASRFSASDGPRPASSRQPNSSALTLGDLDEGNDQIAQIQSETEEYLARISEAKAELNVLMLKTHGYARNSSITYKDVLPKSEGGDSYHRSPFGKRLQISDYSYSLVPLAAKKRK
jgi:hypothetical protein